MEEEQFSNFHYTLDAEFHDALDEFPFVDASNSFEQSNQSVSKSDPEINNDESTVTFIPNHTPDSPSSPSSAGLRRRRRVFFPPKKLSESQLIDSALNLKDIDKSNENLNSVTVNRSSDSHGSSVITSTLSDDERVNVDSSNSAPDLLFKLAELVIDVIGFQIKLLTNSVKFSIWLIHYSYLLLNNPSNIIRVVRYYYMQGIVSGIWGICYYICVKLINYLGFQNHESALKLCVRIGWGLLWFGYCCFVLVCLLVPAFLFGGVMVKRIVEEPVRITEGLNFDYTKDAPMAFVPIISCPESSFVLHNQKSNIRSSAESRAVPFDHELKATVSLVLPESDYNRHLGIFQVRVDFLSSDGKLLASTRKPCMLQFKSDLIRLLTTFVKLAYLLTGYPSETQTLDINLSGYNTEKDVPLSCLRVVIEQRAEFAKGGGVPELYSASLKLESQFSFLKRMLWYWKWLIYMWISMMMFIVELLFTLLCCTPVIFPWVRRVGSSSINIASHNKPPG